MSDLVLIENLHNLAIAVGDEVRAIRDLVNENESNLDALDTVDKTSLVAAINELKSGIGGGVAAIIENGSPKLNKAWSSKKVADEIDREIDDAVKLLRGNVAASLNSLQKIANSIGNQPNLIGYINSTMSNRVRVDTPNQGLTTAQMSNARRNIGAVSTTDIGPDTDFVAIFRTGLLDS